ncbi:transposase [Beijerinckia indica]|uniref:transposase n=1 Tax=Beijerinckia indica TaxID=533 RepID=UPI0011D1459A|nr:transposase [Beijerinckia indica]
MTITELTPGTKDDKRPRRFEVFTGSGRRRDWSQGEKALIAAENRSSDPSICAVARRRGLSSSQLFHGGISRGRDKSPIRRLCPRSCQTKLFLSSNYGTGGGQDHREDRGKCGASIINAIIQL